MSLAQLTAEELLWSIWGALRRIEDNMALPPAPLELPAPQINIAPPDLADVVTAVTSLKPGPTAEEIAAAIASTLSPALPQQSGAASLDAVAAALEKLDFRLKGMGVQAYGGGTVTIDPNVHLPVTGPLTDTQLRATPVPVSAASLPLPSGAATETTLAGVASKLTTPSTIYNNQVTVATAGTRVQVSAASVSITGAILQALSTNAASIWIGSSAVSASNGYELQAGQATSVAIDNLNKIYVDASTSGDKLCYVGF